MFSEDEIRIINTPIRDLSKTELAIAFSLSDKIVEHNKVARKNFQLSGNIKISLLDKDKLLTNGVVSPLDQKSVFHNRADWGDHLKRNGCVEIGNDYGDSTKKKREIKGDFDCRDALGQAVQQVGEKYGY